MDCLKAKGREGDWSQCITNRIYNHQNTKSRNTNYQNFTNTNTIYHSVITNRIYKHQNKEIEKYKAPRLQKYK